MINDRFVVLSVMAYMAVSSVAFLPQYKESHFLLREVNSIKMKSSSISFDVKDPNIAIGAGVTGLLLLLVNRFTLSTISDIQSRADIISVLSCSALLLNSLSIQDIQARDRDPVALAGYALNQPLVLNTLSSQLNASLTWACKSIINNAPVSSVHIIWNQQILARYGVVGAADNLESSEISLNSMPILRSVIGDNDSSNDNNNGGKEIYLPDFQILPGKIEFSYLPINCQSVFILPIGGEGRMRGALIVATNQAKVLKTSDTKKIRAIASILQSSLE